jgi:hypothetical protein
MINYGYALDEGDAVRFIPTFDLWNKRRKDHHWRPVALIP